MTNTGEIFSRERLIEMLSLHEPKAIESLFGLAKSIAYETFLGDVYMRGLIEVSNICAKNCNYCGIRADNKNIQRYLMPIEKVEEAAQFAFDNNLGSVVIQSGERNDKAFTDYLDDVIKMVMRISDGKLAITLSCGEQSEETYRRWFESGAKRYLLRIETTNIALYKTIHPNNNKHNFSHRLEALTALKDIGYITGTGVMIGLPGQTIADLADDLLFFRDLEVDMVGMGPYLVHAETPMAADEAKLLPIEKRFELSMKMISALRILMPDINIAASTALQAIKPEGRMLALHSGANVMMPNITPVEFTENYFLYDGKPGTTIEPTEKLEGIISDIRKAGFNPCFNVAGNPPHFYRTQQTV